MKEFTQSISRVAIHREGFLTLLKHNAVQTRSNIQRRLQTVRDWFRLKKLECNLRESRGFQKYCEKIGCPTLAKLEKDYQETLIRRIGRRKHRATFSSPTPQNLNLQTKL